MGDTREIHLARPCVEDPTLFMAESNLSRGLNMEIVCDNLKQLKLPELRCSAHLGVARFKLDNWQVMIYRNGRIDIRRVSSVDDANVAIDKVENMLQNAFIN